MQVCFTLLTTRISFWFSVRTPRVVEGQRNARHWRIYWFTRGGLQWKEVGGQEALFFRCLKRKRGTKTVWFCVASGGSVRLRRTPRGLFKKGEAEAMSMFSQNGFRRSCLLHCTAETSTSGAERAPCARLLPRGRGRSPRVMSVRGTAAGEGPLLLYCCFISKDRLGKYWGKKSNLVHILRTLLIFNLV